MIELNETLTQTVINSFYNSNILLPVFFSAIISILSTGLFFTNDSLFKY